MSDHASLRYDWSRLLDFRHVIEVYANRNEELCERSPRAEAVVAADALAIRLVRGYNQKNIFTSDVRSCGEIGEGGALLRLLLRGRRARITSLRVRFVDGRKS